MIAPSVLVAGRYSSPSFSLYDNLKRGSGLIYHLGDGYTGMLRNWQQTIKRKGGYWLAQGDMPSTAVSLDVMLEMYLEGMARHIIGTVGGSIIWEGFIIEMELTLNGVTFVRSLLPCANAVRAIYSKVGDNLFSDGSAESGAWTQVGTPSTHERVTTWSTKGTYGMHVVTNGSNEGTQIESGIAITAGRAYQCHVTVEAVSGTWTLAIHRSDNDEILAQRSTAATGKDLLAVYLSDDNEYAGNTYVRLTAAGSGAEIYADAAVYQLSPVRTETEWTTDDDSIAEWGRIEDVLLEATMTDAAANAKIAKEIKKRAWPRSLPPEKFYSGRVQSNRENNLSIMFAGYVFTLNWLFATSTGGTDTASNHVTSLIGESEFISTGVIESNSLEFQVDEENPVRLWDTIEDIIEAGDGSGNRWLGGVYGARRFNYMQVPTDLEYRYRGGVLVAGDGSPIEPWFVLPGLVHLDDAPAGPGSLTGDIADDPRNVYLEEVTYIAPDTLEFVREDLE